MTIRERLSTAIRTAMRARDREALATYRCARGAIDNAEALDITAPAGGWEQSSVGVGSTEATRRHLSEADLARIIRSEILELSLAAQHSGPRDHERLLREANRLERLLHD